MHITKTLHIPSKEGNRKRVVVCWRGLQIHCNDVTPIWVLIVQPLLVSKTRFI